MATAEAKARVMKTRLHHLEYIDPRVDKPRGARSARSLLQPTEASGGKNPDSDTA